jgi:hypothetical protein
MAKRLAASRLIEWACGSFCRWGLALEPSCWMNDDAGWSRPSPPMGRQAMLPPL